MKLYSCFWNVPFNSKTGFNRFDWLIDFFFSRKGLYIRRGFIRTFTVLQTIQWIGLIKVQAIRFCPSTHCISNTSQISWRRGSLFLCKISKVSAAFLMVSIRMFWFCNRSFSRSRASFSLLTLSFWVSLLRFGDGGLVMVSATGADSSTGVELLMPPSAWFKEDSWLSFRSSSSSDNSIFWLTETKASSLQQIYFFGRGGGVNTDVEVSNHIFKIFLLFQCKWDRVFSRLYFNELNEWK